jgi:glucose-1-phosphate adenylyltransferase
MLEKTLAIVLAGGAGSRLRPLTDERAKPAVPFGGKYRIIDFTLTNCLNSGLRRVLVMTQYKSHSLQKHLRDGWTIFNPELGEYITTVPPQMRSGEQWYTGTADAIYQNRWLLERSSADWVLILSGDHIYRMDYAPLIEAHARHGGAATIACMEIPLSEAGAFGVMELDPRDEARIAGFAEKPAKPLPMPDELSKSLVSMGIYVFSTAKLLQCLEEDHALAESSHDFGRDILPRLIPEAPVYAYRFGGREGRVSVDRYWRDVGTLDAYYAANMDLLRPVPPIDLYQEDWQIRSYAGQHPPARTVPGISGNEGICINSIVASGVVISGGSAQASILFSGVVLDDESVVQEAILLDGVKVGSGAHLRRCIVDKGVVIPPEENIGLDSARDRERFTVTERGVVVVPKGYRFADA